MICLSKTSPKSNFFSGISSFLQEINVMNANINAIKSWRFNIKSACAIIIFVYAINCRYRTCMPAGSYKNIPAIQLYPACFRKG